MSSKPTNPPLARRSRRKRIGLIVCAVLVIIVIALAIGLGVGLTRGGSGSTPSAPSSAPTSTVSPLPSPTVQPAWTPTVNSTWQIVLENPLELSSDAASITPDVEVYDIDLFTNGAEVISTLHKLGKKVICYFSAGSYEPDRPDSGDFKDADKGKEMDGWPGEYWLNLNSTNVRNIMTKRVELAAQKGCDAVDPDNVDGYSNNNGLSLTPADSIAFLSFLSNATLTHKLSLGLKNAAAIIDAVLPLVHFSVNEQCAQYAECSNFTAFITHHKPVFHIEYPDAGKKVSTTQVNDYCGAAADAANFSTVIKLTDLDGWVEYCNYAAFTTLLNSS
ncbi:uncharacterized protein BDZ99DRAFT_54321 [Mytilinidion resinicola]|uniref:alpha-galactosidase n=1 Tax=Mytilinidion resinicola TaxID=574789 RepID=A0A6A6YHU7_9PEZI|nr:uncharacterized protein BDZ99DRAFT_54321 [Mytilinidion resinicola]KAF2808371.1 hypothetical protein BDZ99DRAFT_54321 [Mytilinidion resinicola]